jgi:hypothetical protein
MRKPHRPARPPVFLLVAGTLACVVVYGFLKFNRAAPASAAAATATVYTAPPPLPALPLQDESQPLPQLVSEGSLAQVQQAFGAANERQWSDGRRFIQFDPASARKLQLYDSFEIQLDPAFGVALGAVANVSEFEGIKRISGTLAGSQKELGGLEGDDGSFSITLSADGNYAAGNFTLAGNAYSLESKGGAGWITKPDTGAKALHRSGDGVL